MAGFMQFFDNAMKGIASGNSPLSAGARGWNVVKDQDAYKRGITQINSGDWEGGVNTIAQRDPETALGLAQYKRKADDALALQQARDEARNQLTPYQQEMLALKRQQLAQGGESNPFNSKNEFINLMGIRNNPQVWDSLPDDQKALVNARLNYMSNNPENIYDTSYQKKSGTLQAERESKNLENQQISRQQQTNLSNAINLIDTLPDNLFMPYSEISSRAGTLTGGMIGMSPEENEKYGYLERTIGSIENDLIAKARSKGQVGINTIAEIRQAAKGLQLGRGKERLRGALQAMYEIEQRLDAMPTVGETQQEQQSVSEGTIVEDANGNRLILRGGQWQQM